jgi:hypothetical protein
VEDVVDKPKWWRRRSSPSDAEEDPDPSADAEDESGPCAQAIC